MTNRLCPFLFPSTLLVAALSLASAGETKIWQAHSIDPRDGETRGADGVRLLESSPIPPKDCGCIASKFPSLFAPLHKTGTSP